MINILDSYNSLKDFFNKTKEFIKINKTSPVTLFSFTTMTEKNFYLHEIKG